jgi:hypothetical protein
MLRHRQKVAAVAGLLPVIAIGAATAATINVKRSNRIVASQVAMPLHGPA